MRIAKQDRTPVFLFLLLLLPEIGTMGITLWWEQHVGGLKRLGLLGGGERFEPFFCTNIHFTQLYKAIFTFIK